MAAAEADVQVYVESLFNRVNRGELDGKNNSIIGMQGLQRGLYYQRTENDWLCILTVPYETLLQGVQNILVYYGIGLVLFLAGMYLLRSAADVTDYYSRMMLFYFSAASLKW